MGVSFGITALAIIILGVLPTVFISVTVILARNKARALKDLQLAKKSTQILKENATYEEISLTPLEIGTSENIAYGHLLNKHLHVDKI